MSDNGKAAKAFTSKIFSVFGGIYKVAIQELAKLPPMLIEDAFMQVIREARQRSGLNATTQLVLLKLLREALNKVIHSAENDGG